ncbi:MAG: DNA-binding protein WhiA [Clostridia bacterium]|nr:DNA-binding protein WhiA [Clostridia bacterium]
MSFSKELKEELSKVTNLSNKEAVKYELIGYLISSNINIQDKKLKFSTENEYNINRFSKLLNNIGINDYDITVQGKWFVITVNKEELKGIKYEKVEIESLAQEQIKWLIRGVYLGAGSINNPERKYHLEIELKQKEIAEMIMKVLQKFNIKSNIIKKKNDYAIYLKDGEEISKLLALLGANKAVLQFEEIRVKREMNNKINRIVNCETANLNKTINASIAQIEAINKLKKNKKFNKLDEPLKEIAELRLKNPDASLTELGQMLQNPVGKSGVNYRLKKIMELANEK